MTRNIHFVGSIKLDNAAEVFESLSDVVGSLAKRYPDGETGERENWVRWQVATFERHPDLEIGDEATRPTLYSIKAGADTENLAFDSLGYAEEALSSYGTFVRLRASGVVPEGVRFQVSLPTPLAVVAVHVVPEDAPAVERAYDTAMLREVQAIVDGIPPEDLAIQWDIAIEVTAFDGGRTLYQLDPLSHAAETVARMNSLIPPDVESGLHLCYGDAGHKHLVEPIDLGTSVLFANSICAAVPDPLAWVHVVVPRDRDDRAYFAPLEGLEIGDAELVLGLVHHTDGLEGTRRRMRAASEFRADYGIATECGFGRRPPETIPALLDVHVKAAAS